MNRYERGKRLFILKKKKMTQTHCLSVLVYVSERIKGNGTKQYQQCQWLFLENSSKSFESEFNSAPRKS